MMIGTVRHFIDIITPARMGARTNRLMGHQSVAVCSIHREERSTDGFICTHLIPPSTASTAQGSRPDRQIGLKNSLQQSAPIRQRIGLQPTTVRIQTITIRTDQSRVMGPSLL